MFLSRLKALTAFPDGLRQSSVVSSSIVGLTACSGLQAFPDLSLVISANNKILAGTYLSPDYFTPIKPLCLESTEIKSREGTAADSVSLWLFDVNKPNLRVSYQKLTNMTLLLKRFQGNRGNICYSN